MCGCRLAEIVLQRVLWGKKELLQREDPEPVPLVTGDPAPMPLVLGCLAPMSLVSGESLPMPLAPGYLEPMLLALGVPTHMPMASGEPAPMLLISGDPGLMLLASRDSASMPLAPGDLASMPLARSPCIHAQGIKRPCTLDILRTDGKGIFLVERSSRAKNSPFCPRPHLLALQMGEQGPKSLRRAEMLTCEWPGSELTPAAVGSKGNENSRATLVDFCFVIVNNGHLKYLGLQRYYWGVAELRTWND